MSSEKRPAADSFGSNQLVKRQRSDNDLGNQVAITNGSSQNGALIQAVCLSLAHFRTLTLELRREERRTMADCVGSAHERAASSHHGAHRYVSAHMMPALVCPNTNACRTFWRGFCDKIRSDWPAHSIRLHGSEHSYVFQLQMEWVATVAETDSAVLWRTYGQCENYGILSGHKGAVLDLHWSRDSRVIFSASADMMLASWDLETGQRIRRHMGHEEVINCMDVSKRGEEMLVSGSDDGYIGVSRGLRRLSLGAEILMLRRSGTRDKKRPSTSSRPSSLSLPSPWQKLATSCIPVA